MNAAGLCGNSAGPFVMGTRADDPSFDRGFGGNRGWYEDETPQHEQTAYVLHRALSGDGGAVPVLCRGERLPTWRCRLLRGETHPVVWVSWDEAQAYCDWLTGALAGVAGNARTIGDLAPRDGVSRSLLRPSGESGARQRDRAHFPGATGRIQIEQTTNIGIWTTSAWRFSRRGQSVWGVGYERQRMSGRAVCGSYPPADRENWKVAVRVMRGRVQPQWWDRALCVPRRLHPGRPAQHRVSDSGVPIRSVGARPCGAACSGLWLIWPLALWEKSGFPKTGFLA